VLLGKGSFGKVFLV
jgi:serine/threonine protein kinase